MPNGRLQGSDQVGVWFTNLKKIQGMMAQLNHLTRDNCKEFSKQTLGELLTSEDMKGNLNQYCQEQNIGLVPDDAYTDMTKTFFWFLNRISISVQETTLQLFYDVAVKYKPDLLQLSPEVVATMTIGEVYGQEPLDSSNAKQELNRLLKDNIPSEFYSTKGAPLVLASRTVQQAINQILDP